MSLMPHGTMWSKYDKSVVTLTAHPWLAIPREICTPIAAIFLSSTQTPVLPGCLPCTHTGRISTWKYVMRGLLPRHLPCKEEWSSILQEQQQRSMAHS